MARKGLGVPQGIPPHLQYYFTVDDIEAPQKRVIAAGGKAILPPMMYPEGPASCRPQTACRANNGLSYLGHAQEHSPA